MNEIEEDRMISITVNNFTFFDKKNLAQDLILNILCFWTFLSQCGPKGALVVPSV